MTASTAAPRLERAQLAGFLLALGTGTFSVALGQIGLGLCLLLGLARWLTGRGAPARTGLEPTTLALVAWALLMIPFSEDPGQSLVYSKRFFLFTALWLGASLAAGEIRRRLLFGVLLAGAAAASLQGVVVMWRRWGGLFVDRLDNVSNPMTSGAVLMLVVLLAFGMLMTRGATTRARLVVGAGLLPVLLALLMTMTRSALLGVAVGTAVMLLVARPRWFFVFAGAGALLVAVVLLFGDQFLSPRLMGRLDPDYIRTGANTTSRLDMWRVGVRMVQAHPVTGVGDCDLLAVAPRYSEGIEVVPFGHLHSNPVHLAVIWGLPGLVLALAFQLHQFLLVLRRWTAAGGRTVSTTPWRRGWQVGALGAWTGFFVAGLTEWYFGDAEPMLLLMAILGVALGRTRAADAQTEDAHA